MVPFHRNLIGLAILVVCINVAANAKKTKHKCPIGFSLAYRKDRGNDPICYRRKGPESFEDKFKDCAGNLFTSKLYHSLNFTEQNLVLWTDYKSTYPGGPFVDQSYTESTGDVLLTAFEVKYDPNLGLNEELCVVIDPVTNFTATRCVEQHYRYCFIQPYDKDDKVETDGCEDLDGYQRFYSPRSTCLTALTSSTGTVRANWRHAKELCGKRGGALLNKGWRYANHPLMSSTPDPTFPLGIVMSPDKTSIRYDTTSDDGDIPASEWYFENKIVPTEMSLGALRDNFWYMVNSSYIFYDVICERSLEIKPVNMNVSVDDDNKLILRINDSVHDRDVYCFTDSVTFYPTQVRARYDDDTRYFVLKPVADGYYWCILVDSTNHLVSESNKALFIREKQSLVNSYAIKIKLQDSYKLENLEKSYRDWENKLEEYIFYRSRYVKVFGELELSDMDTAEEKLKSFKSTHPALKWKDMEPINKIKIKRFYLDVKTALVHVQLNPEMGAVGPGKWENLQVEYMKPIYYCKGFESVPMLSLGTTYTSTGCRTYTCVGDFAEGVQWVTTAAEGCSTVVPTTVRMDLRVKQEVEEFMPTIENIPTTTAVSTTTDSAMYYVTQQESDSSEEDVEVIKPTFPTPIKPPPTTWRPTRPTTTEPPSTVIVVTSPTTVAPEDETISTAIPTFPPTTTLAPEEQLQEVLHSLETLLNNGTVAVTMQDAEDTFDKVDLLLEMENDLEIPGNFLHLLDELGARVDLNGSHQATAVRSNIALVMADAAPDTPVRGLRIAAREDGGFADGAFEIISDEVNDTQLATNTSEALVQLPDSIANSSRRISFVVFRNDRAFHPNNQVYSVNSRVLSINVENITTFDDGEFIDIHLSPDNPDPTRNVSRACAFWHFSDNGTGYWSQEGCTLIKSTEDGMLDTCRCNHLTHFAEILVPATTFSERHELTLEILSIVGCVISIIGLILIGVTAALFRSWRRDFSNKIWLQLCVAIFMLSVCFLVVVFARFEVYNIPCLLVGILLHYSTMASFCWMLVAAILSYRRLVIVFTRDASHKLLRASAFSWGFPCAIVGILLSIDPHAYSTRMQEMTTPTSFCYPSGLGLWLSIYAPIAVTLLANWVLFILIVRSVFASRRIQRHGDSNEALRCASVSCLLVFLFGLPWVFGLFAFNIVAAYLFVITANFQGFVLFLFFVLGNKKTRDLWLNKLKIKQTRKVPVTSSTYTHRSTGAGYRGGQGTGSIEANSQKPRSLSSPDNSRFS